MGMGGNMLIMLFCISFALYLLPQEMGGTTSMYNAYKAKIGSDTSAMSLSSASLINVLLGSGGLSIVAGIAAYSYGVIYVIPAMVAVWLISFFLLPISYIGTEIAMPIEINYFLTGLFGIMILIIIVDFIRGGEL